MATQATAQTPLLSEQLDLQNIHVNLNNNNIYIYIYMCVCREQ